MQIAPPIHRAMISHASQPTLLRLHIVLSILGICMLGAHFWIDRWNSAELDEIGQEIDRVHKKLHGPERDAAEFVKKDGGAAVEALDQRLAAVHWKEESPYSAQNVLLYAGLSCIFISSVMVLAHFKRREPGSQELHESG